jgi:uncharacterized protein (TIRG00374 family)
MRAGVSFIDAFTVSLVNLGATLIFMPLAGLLAVFFMDDHLIHGIVPHLLRYGFGFFTLFLLGFLLAFWKPLWIGAFIHKLASFVAILWPKKKERLLQWSEQTNMSIRKYQHTSKVLLTQHPFLFPLSLLLTTVLYLNKYVMQYVILLGLGVQSDLLQVISIQVLIQFMIYFAPTPGGSGFAEMSIAVLFEKIVSSAILPLFTLLQRSFLLFFPAIIGAVVIIQLLRKQTMEVAQQEREEEKDRSTPLSL